MVINRHQFNAAAIRLGVIFGPADNPDATGPENLYLVEQVDTMLGEDGGLSENLSVSGRDLAGMFDERLVLPTVGQAYDTQTSVAAETAMKHYVDVNAINAADPNRNLPNYAIAADLGRGATITYKARYQRLSDVLEEIGRLGGLGYQVKLNFITEAFDFDVIPGTDRSVGNGVNNPVILSPNFDTSEGLRWLRSHSDYKSVAYVLGQGEGVARSVEVVQTAPAPFGFTRRELMVDARDVDTTALLQDRGTVRLQQHGVQELLEVDLAPQSAFAYRTDWNLGDIVTVYNPAWDLDIALRVIEVTRILEPRPGYTKTEVVLGAPYPRLQDRVEQAVGDLSAVERV